MNPQLCLTHEDQFAAALRAETLTASQWSLVLGVNSRSFRRWNIAHNRMDMSNGGLTKFYSFDDLPKEYQERAKTLLNSQRASTFQSLLHMREVETRWVPDRAFEAYPAETKRRAELKKKVAEVYFMALDANKPKGEANTIARAEWLKLFGEECSFSTIQRLEKRVEECGGIAFAPREAYCDGKSTPHHRSRRHVKLGIPLELIEEFKLRSTKTEHITAAFYSLETDWLMGREVPGLGVRQGEAAFPFKYKQLRDYAASTPARKGGSHGKARMRREALPFLHTTTATLRRCELLLLDDTRIDIVATRDVDGKPVELKSYWLMDVATRQILAFVIKEGDALKAEDVFAMLSRAFRTTGLPVGYTMHIKFERGSVACSAAAQTLLESIWPGRIEVHRTGMDGGRNHAADFIQKGSGHWMGKSHIESFMRTLAYRLEHIPGQRGGSFRRQPAQLGLSAIKQLDYSAGSQIHEAHRGELADRALRLINNGDVQSERQLKIEALKPVSWCIDAIKEAVAIYNANTNHRMEGFARIESQDPATGRLEWRMESPNERALALEQRFPTERISEADSASLIKWRGLKVTVRKDGVTFDCAPWKGLNFWKEGSIVCHEVLRLTTCKREYVALFDADAIRHFIPGQDNSALEIHILGGVNPDKWTPGEPGRYIETLPLAAFGNRADAEDMADKAGKLKKVEARYQSELIQASRPALARELARVSDNIPKLEGAITLLNTARAEAAGSELLHAVDNAAGPEGRAVTRREEQPRAASDLEKFLDAHQPQESAAEAEPEIF